MVRGGHGEIYRDGDIEMYRHIGMVITWVGIVGWSLRMGTYRGGSRPYICMLGYIYVHIGGGRGLDPSAGS